MQVSSALSAYVTRSHPTHRRLRSHNFTLAPSTLLLPFLFLLLLSSVSTSTYAEYRMEKEGGGGGGRQRGSSVGGSLSWDSSREKKRERERERAAFPEKGGEDVRRPDPTTYRTGTTSTHSTTPFWGEREGGIKEKKKSPDDFWANDTASIMKNSNHVLK